MANEKSDFSLIAFVINCILLPVSVPYLIFKFLQIIRLRFFKECLPGKVVLITGASSGLGEAMAHVFYMSGCKGKDFCQYTSDPN
jgi:dehydrogenase/reductase SDR family protein 7B